MHNTMHKIDTTDIGSAIGDHLTFTLGKRPETETVHDVYMALLPSEIE